MNPRLLRRLLLGFIRDFEGEEFDKEFVALSGAHTLGRSIPDCSGWGKPETKYTKDGLGAPGGQSWTVQWLRFYNSYFKDIKEKKDKDLLVLPTDATLFEDPSFKVYAEKYAEDQEAFFKDYAEAHAKLSNLGAKFDPPEAYTWITRTRMHGRTLWAYAGHYRDYA